MRKTLLTTLAILAVGTTFAGENTPYSKGSRVASAGVGFGMAGVYGSSVIPPLNLSFDYGYNENISFGALGGFSQSSYDYPATFGFGGYSWTYTYIIVGGRGAYHFTELFNGQPIDPYIGAILGYNIVSVSASAGGTTSGASGSYLLFGGNLGARYWFTPKLGAQVELGYGVGLLSLGLSYKM